MARVLSHLEGSEQEHHLVPVGLGALEVSGRRDHRLYRPHSVVVVRLCTCLFAVGVNRKTYLRGNSKTCFCGGWIKNVFVFTGRSETSLWGIQKRHETTRRISLYIYTTHGLQAGTRGTAARITCNIIIVLLGSFG